MRGNNLHATARVHRLESSVIDRIATGGVVEKPASAVKELVEVNGGGIEQILVRDDPRSRS